MGILKSNRRGVTATRARYDAAYGLLEEAGPWYDPNNEGLCIWAAYQPVGAADFAASLVDLSGNGNNAGDPGGAATPAWAALTGWTFDGASDYLTTAFIPQNDQSQSGIVQFTNVGDQDYLFGVRSGNGRVYGIIPNTGGVNVRYLNGGNTNVVPGLLAGNLCVAGNQGYRNGAAEGAAIAAWGGASTQPAYIGGRNNAGVADSWVNARIQTLALYDCVLTAPQVSAITTAMAAL